MSVEEDERNWAADKRSFVADEREATADAREREADERESSADAREAELDEWERLLLDGAASGSADGAHTASALLHTDDAADRRRMLAQRLEARRRRELAGETRVEASRRRMVDGHPAMLAMAFAQIAEHLFEADSYDDVLGRIAEAAVSTIGGCGMASVTVPDQGGYRTAASTSSAATEVDQAQYDADEGPCLDAFAQSVVYAASFPDRRWPSLAARPTESGVRSVLSYRLTSSRDGVDSAAGSLNSYGLTADAFDDEALEIGLVLAAHASVAARTVQERTDLAAAGAGLQQALLSRDVIGQAKGILMERLHVTAEDAFDMLRRSSQHLNLKLRHVASRLAETGELPDEPKKPSAVPGQ